MTVTSLPSAAGASVPLRVTSSPNTTDALESTPVRVCVTGDGSGAGEAGAAAALTEGDAATGSGVDPKAGAARASTQTAATTTSASAETLRLTRPMTTSRIDVLPP